VGSANVLDTIVPLVIKGVGKTNLLELHLIIFHLVILELLLVVLLLLLLLLHHQFLQLLLVQLPVLIKLA